MNTRQHDATDVHEQMRGDTAVPVCCPVCGQRDTLIALGVRYDHPYRWRPWAIRPTPLALCERCDALMEVRETSNGSEREWRRRVAPSPAMIGA